jgi:hypothetical protein
LQPRLLKNRPRLKKHLINPRALGCGPEPGTLVAGFRYLPLLKEDGGAAGDDGVITFLAALPPCCAERLCLSVGGQEI